MEISTLNFSKLQERLRKLVTCNGSFMWRLWKQKCKVARECARVTRTREKPYSFCQTIQQPQVKDIGEQALFDFAAHQLLIIRCFLNAKYCHLYTTKRAASVIFSSKN